MGDRTPSATITCLGRTHDPSDNSTAATDAPTEAVPMEAASPDTVPLPEIMLPEPAPTGVDMDTDTARTPPKNSTDECERACSNKKLSNSRRGIADPTVPNVLSGQGAVTEPPNPCSFSPWER